MTTERQKVLVVGVFLSDKPHHAVHVTEELARSSDWKVDQKWIALGSSAVPPELAGLTVAAVRQPSSKFALINSLLANAPYGDYAFVIVCDDDIRLPAGFLDTYLTLVCKHDFALAQPARTHDSYIDHPFVEQLDGIQARWTRFVEIGPLFSIRRDATSLLLPFDEASPMGWGYDLVWPHVLETASLKLGIVDATAVAHTLRKPVAHYSYPAARDAMDRFLDKRPHLSKYEAFRIIESYA